MITKDQSTIKIIDFGSCKDMEGTDFEKKFDLEREKRPSKKPTYKNFVGTPNYMAPECVRNKKSDFKSDIWSLGCLLYNMFTGFPPFLGKSDYLVFQKSTIANFSFPEDIIPDDAMDLISKLIVIDPEKRLTIEEIYNHKYISSILYENNAQEEELNMIKNKMKLKFIQYKDFTNKLERIKKYEQMEEECRKNNIEEEKDNPITMEDKKLLPDKTKFLEQYELGLQTYKEELQNYINNSQEKSFINKLKFFDKQLSHDIFGKDYEGEVKTDINV